MRNYFKVTKRSVAPKGFSELLQLRRAHERGTCLDAYGKRLVESEREELTPTVVAEAFYFFDHFDVVEALTAYEQAATMAKNWGDDTTLSVWRKTAVAKHVPEIGILMRQEGRPPKAEREMS